MWPLQKSFCLQIVAFQCMAIPRAFDPQEHARSFVPQLLGWQSVARRNILGSQLCAITMIAPHICRDRSGGGGHHRQEDTGS